MLINGSFAMTYLTRIAVCINYQKGNLPDYSSPQTVIANMYVHLHDAGRPMYKFTPVTSVNVERSFSMYTTRPILSDNRLTSENLTKILVYYRYFLSLSVISEFCFRRLSPFPIICFSF